MTPAPDSITARLAQVSPADYESWNELTPLVYESLRRLAHAYMREYGAKGVLQPTALVHETYLLLLRQKTTDWKNRAQFFGIAALLMRRILVDEARRQKVSTRVMEQIGAQRGPAEPGVNLCELNDALERLATIDARQAEVVDLRYFGGLTIEETAEFLQVSSRTVKRDWEMARSWLRAELRKR